jgi:HlyD family secretion protein
MTTVADAPKSSGTSPLAPSPSMKKPQNRRGLLLLALLAVAAVVLAAIVYARTRPPSGILASGTIEAVESDLATKVQGRLIELRVRDGDVVRKGQVLAVLEQVDPGLTLAQARAALAAAAAQTAAARAAYEVQAATYPTTVTQANEGVSIARSGLGQAGQNLEIERQAATLAIDQASAQLAAARSTAAHAKIDLGRAQSLVATGDEARRILDDARNAAVNADAQVRAATDAVKLAEANMRTVRIRRLQVLASRSQRGQSIAALGTATAQHDLVAQRFAQLQAATQQEAQARAALGLAQDQVRETQVIAPRDGVVISHNFEVGDLIQPGAAVMTVGDLIHPYMYVYVSELQLPHVKTGSRADVTIDGMPGKTFVGTVTEIGTTAEFTPENVQTAQQRIEYLVFPVKIEFTDTTGTLKPGIPADAVFRS